MNIDGVLTWIVATVIVWLAGMLVGLILASVFLKDRTAGARGR